MTSGEHGPAVGTTLRDKERFARTEVLQDGEVVNGTHTPFRKLKPWWFMGHG
jgi:hypothetical protein